MKPEKDRKQAKREELERIVKKSNAKLIPETKGYVRIEGPRRQYKASIDSLGYLVYKEI